MFDGGAERTNLTFEVIPTSGGEKFAHIHQVLTSYLPPETAGGAIVYCATRRQSEEVAEFLQLKDISAEHFHAGLPPETKKDVQRRFIGGELRAIAATNAFGMGIDKPDVRLVVHADIPGSLENYLQEAGRGRSGSRGGAVRADVCDGRCGAPVRHVGPFSSYQGGDPRPPQGVAQPGSQETPGRRGGGHRRRNPGRGRGQGVPEGFLH